MIVFGGSFFVMIKRVRMRNHHAVCKKMRVTVGNRRLDNKQVNRQYQRKNQLSIFPDESQVFWFSGKINIQSVSRFRQIAFSLFLGMFLRLDY